MQAVQLIGRLFTFTVFLCFWIQAGGQTVYNMQNAFVTDCEGVLLDSDNGPEEGQYDHNENYTFTICVEGATEIIVAFEFFATEENYDILTIYDGPDTNSPVLASLSGSLQPPPTVVATSGCITFHFISDDNIVATGWRANWRVEVSTPPLPQISLVSEVECPMDEAVFRVNIPLNCDQFVPENFSVLGPGGSQVVSVTPMDCAGPVPQGTTFSVTFAPPLSNPVNYRLLFEGSIEDGCGEWHDFSTNVLFLLTNCPLSVYIETVGEPGCEGECGEVTAIVSGGGQTTYSYSWAHTPTNNQTVDVCTDLPLNLSVTVTDNQTMQTAQAVYEYTPLPNPVILNPIQDTMCATNGDHFYQVSPGGGEFWSQIIPDNQRTSGRYQFWRWSNGDPVNTDIVSYIAPNGCIARDTVVVLQISLGSNRSTCVGSNSFFVGGGTPAGGVWTGPHITDTGVFDPVEEGSFVIRYTAPNGCTGTKRINVVSEITMPDLDTVCTSQLYFLEATPPNGSWSGPGVVNPNNGRFEPWRPAPNQTYTYTYNILGCSESIDIYINEIWAGDDRAICVTENLLPLNIEGSWTGPGVYLEDDNAFDISGLGVGEYTYRLEENGCTDEFILYIVNTQLNEITTLDFCPGDDRIPVRDFVEIIPGSGQLTGPGIYWNNDEWYFDAAAAGPGLHMIYLDALNCRDSIEFSVEPWATMPEFSFCEHTTPLILQASPAGGHWEGPGFLDEQTGLFDPQQLPIGEYEVYYVAPSGCVTPAPVEIFLFQQVSITGFQQQYCQRDTGYLISLTPGGGIFTINGVETDPEINPVTLGAGVHELLYRRGVGACASSERRFITVLEPIVPTIPLVGDSICQGQQAVVEITANGGLGGLTYTWDQGLGFGNSQIVRPDESTWYTVQVSDQCSTPYTDSVLVYVYPAFDIPIIQGNPVCYEDSTFATINMPQPGNYTVVWQTNPPVNQPRFDGRPGVYQVEVTEVSSGCSQTMAVTLPGALPIRANFSLYPNQPCIDIINNEIEVIDLSLGYTSGWIDFGDGSPVFDLSVPGSIQHAYRDTGMYTIQQVIFNDLGCTDSIERQICVENRVRLFVPTGFSPNEDGVNDRLEIFGLGIDEVEWTVYDRQGALMFRGFGLEESWDGTHKNRLVNPGTYIVVVQYYDPILKSTEVYKGEVVLMR